MRDALGDVQTVLLLGGTSEIGRAAADAIVGGRAATVVTAGRSGCDHYFDALDFDSHERLVDEVWDRWGDIDVVLLAFGVLGADLAAVETNYTGAVSVTLPIVRRLRAQGHGAIVALSSVAGVRARRSNYVYGSAKAGVDAFFSGLRLDLAETGVDVLVVRPGFVHTKMTSGMRPAPFATTPEHVGAAIAEGLRQGRDVVWVPSILRYVMAVVRLLPTPIFARLPE